jgi:D-3-phosphoglycerate dehydrogenase
VNGSILNRPVVGGVELVELGEVLASSDVVTLHVLRDPSTRGLINSRTLDLVKPGAILINTARGGAEDESALVDALRSGRLSGPGLDVKASEPMPIENPLVAMPTVILTPHSAFYNEESLVEIKRRVSIDTVAAP